MATFTKLKLSGSTDGRAVKVAATASPGTTIHTAHATDQDEIWLYAHNSSVSLVAVTIQFGGTTSPDDEIKFGLQAQQGLYLVVPGLVLTNSAVVRAFAATANVVLISGFVNRITP